MRFDESQFSGLSAEDRQLKEMKLKRRMLGNVKFVGELFAKGMLNEKIMHQCIQHLLRVDSNNPDEDNLESMCKLMTTIGKMLDHEKAKNWMDVYFDMMRSLEDKRSPENGQLVLSNRIRFMLRDVRDLRACNWVPRKSAKVEGPKHIEEVRREAVMAQQQKDMRGGGRPMSGAAPSASSSRQADREEDFFF